MQSIQTVEQLLKIIENLRYILFGLSICLPVILILLSYIFKQFAKKFEKVESIELLQYRIKCCEDDTKQIKTDIDKIESDVTKLKQLANL